MPTKKREPSTPDQIHEVKGRLDETDARVNALISEEQEINREIASRLAGGRDLGDLQDRRRKVRDDIEALNAALPLLRVRLEELQALFQREVKQRETEAFAERAAALRGRLVQLDGDLAAVLGRAQELVGEMSVFKQEASILGFGLGARFQDGTLIRWRIEALMMGVGGFSRPSAQVRPLSLRETACRELDGVVARAQHAVEAAPAAQEQEPVPA